ncbi:hypothetical protein [Pararhizobium sp.]|uniref:hypothetical protein n=1 Tax=Pararhizobium sp. TaxID=1977563 RepID=UPI002724904C|nr:hypothetical protein [Pararhizobium sp.]MDO9418574.1 hypothetical protein [Pararhizobium sp.]
MKPIWIAVCLIALAGCTSEPRELRPIPGSITYGGQPRTKLQKSPIGSIVSNRLTDEYGRKAEETYVIQPDRSLKLVRRRALENEFFPE